MSKKPNMATLWESTGPQNLTGDQEMLKKQIYESLNPRRRKFIDKIGYETWDPFQKPKEPMTLRTDLSRRTTQELFRDFMHSLDPERAVGNDFSKGALDCALGLVGRDERYQGIFEFCLWYYELLEQEGYFE